MVNKEVILALEIKAGELVREQGRNFTVHRPNVQQHRNLSLQDLQLKYERIDERAARKYWDKHYEESRHTCYHKYMLVHNLLLYDYIFECFIEVVFNRVATHPGNSGNSGKLREFSSWRKSQVNSGRLREFWFIL